MAHKKTTVRPYFYDPSLKLSRCAKAEIFYWLLWQKSFTQSSICFCFYCRCRLQKQASQGRSFSSTKMKKDIPQKSGGKNGRIWSRLNDKYSTKGSFTWVWCVRVWQTGLARKIRKLCISVEMQLSAAAACIKCMSFESALGDNMGCNYSCNSFIETRWRLYRPKW